MDFAAQAIRVKTNSGRSWPTGGRVREEDVENPSVQPHVEHDEENDIMEAMAAMGREIIRLRRQSHPRATAQPPCYLLGPREVEVLSHVVEGRTNAEIGVLMHISAATVKCHLEHIMVKMDVSNRTAAATNALRHGVLD